MWKYIVTLVVIAWATMLLMSYTREWQTKNAVGKFLHRALSSAVRAIGIAIAALVAVVVLIAVTNHSG